MGPLPHAAPHIPSENLPSLSGSLLLRASDLVLFPDLADISHSQLSVNYSEDKLWAPLFYGGKKEGVQGNPKMEKSQKGEAEGAKDKLGGIPSSLEERATPRLRASCQVPFLRLLGFWS